MHTILSQNGQTFGSDASMIDSHSTVNTDWTCRTQRFFWKGNKEIIELFTSFSLSQPFISGTKEWIIDQHWHEWQFGSYTEQSRAFTWAISGYLWCECMFHRNTVSLPWRLWRNREFGLLIWSNAFSTSGTSWSVSATIPPLYSSGVRKTKDKTV